MKKLLILSLFVLMFSSLYSQTPLTEAVDFTLTDVDGNEHTLFDYLEDGKYVLIDFFYTACGPCQSTAPKIEEAYQYFGCNTGDLIVLGMDFGDSDAEVIAFGETYGATYPAISGDAGGTGVCATYLIPAYPTIIIIAPNGDIVKQDIWPIANGAYLIGVIEPYGPEATACAPSTETEINIFSLDEQTGEATINDGTVDIEVEYGTDLATLVPEFTLSQGAVATIEGDEQTSGTTVVDFSSGTATYLITAEDGIATQEWVITVTVADASTETLFSDFSLPEQTESATIGSGTISIEVANGTDISSLIPEFTLSTGAIATIDGDEQTSASTVVDFSLGPVTYLITAQDEVSTQEWVITVTEEPTFVYENNQKINVYPIPANNIVNITNAENYELSIFNITGKKIIEKTLQTDKEIINLQEYPSGFYSLKLIKNNDIRIFKINIVK